ncbi:hypothetical protein ACFVJ8_01265 [Streptomyces yangpuensis]|uniref:hypothetical protein n=1 Tax=Streptomyces yangpuensis TaxID=1648182 RepID=UPI00362774D1
MTACTASRLPRTPRSRRGHPARRSATALTATPARALARTLTVAIAVAQPLIFMTTPPAQRPHTPFAHPLVRAPRSHTLTITTGPEFHHHPLSLVRRTE